MTPTMIRLPLERLMRYEDVQQRAALNTEKICAITG